MTDHESDEATPIRALLEEPVDAAGRGRRVREEDRAFSSSLVWSLASAVIPGSGLFRARQRVWGSVMIGFLLLLTIVVGGLWLFARRTLYAQVFQASSLTAMSIGVAVFGVIWVTSIVVTHLALRPKSPALWQRVLGSLFVGVLCLAVALPSAYGARMLYDTGTLVRDVLPSGGGTSSASQRPFIDTRDPWADKPRLNVLLLGGDSGKTRNETLGARTDTVILASINTKTGDTVLFSLPRQTARMPFPPDSPLHKYWPNGFTNGNPLDQEYALNAIYDTVPTSVDPKIFAGVENPGAEALKISVGYALGLDVDYYALVDMDGFVNFIDALGGITVNINKPIPMGGNSTKKIPPDRWLEPGPNQHLNGNDALWYARGRYGTVDYERMARQRCVINAVIQQASPLRVVANYESLVRAGKQIVRTDVPGSAMPDLVELAGAVKGKKLRSISFENNRNGFSTVNPNWDRVREQVIEGLDPAAPTQAAPTPSSSATPTRRATPTTKASPSVSATPAGPAHSVTDECAYNPVPR